MLKIGQNLLEMEVTTCLRIQKLIWDKLLASKVEIIRRQALFSFSCRKPRSEILSAQLSACSAVCFFLGFFLTERSVRVMFVFFGCYGRLSIRLLTQGMTRGDIGR